MFFDDKLVLDKCLCPMWKAGNGQEVQTNIPLGKMCKRLQMEFENDHPDPRSRLSLRTAAVLLHGVTRLYNKRGEELAKDLLQLEEEMMTRKKDITRMEARKHFYERQERESDSTSITFRKKRKTEENTE